jgi:hypothetical protein
MSDAPASQPELLTVSLGALQRRIDTPGFTLGFKACPIRLFGRRVHAKVGFIDSRSPFTEMRHPVDAEITTSIVLTETSVTHIGRLVANSKVGAPTIKPVAVEMVDVLISRGRCDLPMKQKKPGFNRIPRSVSSSVNQPGPGPLGVPVILRQMRVASVYNRDVALGQAQFDSPIFTEHGLSFKATRHRIVALLSHGLGPGRAGNSSGPTNLAHPGAQAKMELGIAA